MGIGSGSVVSSSGEKVPIKKLEQQYVRAEQPLIIFDVGSNKGQFLNLLIDGLRSRSIQSQMHAFEPSRWTFEYLYEKYSDYPNITLNNFGLGSKTGQSELFYDKIGSGLASLSKRRLDHKGIEFEHSEIILLQRLDSYCEEHGIRMIDLLKLDVEGHELDVLAGGSQMLQEQRIRMVTFEFGSCNIDSRTYFQDFWYFFHENGMGSIFRITPGGYLVHIPRYLELHEQFSTTNFLALQSDDKS